MYEITEAAVVSKSEAERAIAGCGSVLTDHTGYSCYLAIDRSAVKGKIKAREGNTAITTVGDITRAD